MDFIKYQHIEKFGNSEVEGIELGTVYVFPKIDGTNASVWKGGCGSRNRELSADKDNAGFYKWVQEEDSLKKLQKDFPNLRLFGEWLVPHSLKTYREDAWREFYVFDVAIDKDSSEVMHEGDSLLKYLPYEEYKDILETYNINYIPPMKIMTNPTYEKIVECLGKNDFLIQDGKGAGEGIVLKNYDFINKYGRQTWAKIVTSEFREKHSKTMGCPEVEYKSMVESDIADDFITQSLCEKVKSKIELEHNGFSGKNIPQLLNTVYYDLIKEESWEFIKKYKYPTINYKTLRHFVVGRIKVLLPEVF